MIHLKGRISSLFALNGKIDVGASNSNGGNSGGGDVVGSVKKKDVNFVDYDGTLLYSYTVDEAKALSDLPPLPVREGLICQGWNYDLASIKEYDRPVTVGAVYITDDGKTRIYITLQEGRTSPMVGLCVNGTATVDWGDGTSPDVITGTSISTMKWTPTHNYASPGEYVISIAVAGTAKIIGGSGSSTHTIISHAPNSDGRNMCYKNSVRKVEIGSGLTTIGKGVFFCCYSLSTITIPNNVTSIEAFAFENCYSLSSMVIPKEIKSIGEGILRSCSFLTSISIPEKITSIPPRMLNACTSISTVTIPNGVTSIGESAFLSCYSLSNIVIPEGITSINAQAFKQCRSLSTITIPNNVTSIAENTFSGCTSLTNMVIPEGITSINAYAFDSSCSVLYYDFSKHASIPTCTVNSFVNIASDCEIRVPASLYDQWKAASGWSQFAANIVAV